MGAGLSTFSRSHGSHEVLPDADLAPAAALPAFLSGKRLGLTSATGERLALVLGEVGLEVQVEGSTPNKRRRATLPSNGLIPYLYVLSVSVSVTGKFSLATLHERGAGKPLSLWTLESDAAAVGSELLATWIADLMSRAYSGIQSERRFLVLVNPHGGQGKAQHIWDSIVEPIFAAAGAKPVLHLTGPSSSPANATTLAQTLELDLYDALVPISGDGITSELINGLALRPDALLALQTPISPIPGGSGNALSVNLFGMERVEDPAFAALNAIKGTPMALDICTVSQGDSITYSFLSQAFGLIADLDIGTEWLRWMGDTRFVLGFLWGVLTRKTYSVELSVKIVESDKAALVAAHNSASTDFKALSPTHPFENKPLAGLTGPFPPLRFGTTRSSVPPSPTHEVLSNLLEPGWHTFKMNVQMLYGGKLPWVAKGSMQFPLARDDGLIDLHLVGPRSISASLKAFDGLERGAYLSLPESYYYKVEAFRVTPLAPKGYISIDGESIPHETFQVENHRGLARVMSMRGRWHGLDQVEL